MENNNLHPENNPDYRIPGIHDSGKKNIFVTPANYFDKLPLEISDKIHAGTSDAAKLEVSPWFLSVTNLKRIGVVSIVAAALFGGFYLFNESQPANKNEAVISYDDLANSSLVAEMDENLLYDIYTQNSSDTSSLDEESLAVQQYLIENNTDISLIINEL